MNKLTLLVDLDSIVVDLGTTWYEEYNRRTGDDLTMDRVDDWDTRLACRFPEQIFPILKEPGFYLRPKPLEGALEGLKAIDAMGHNLILLSAAPSVASLTDKGHWVEKHLPWFNTEKKLVLGYPKQLVRGDILFDDGPHNITGYREAWGHKARIATIAYPYNVEAQPAADVIVGHWREPRACWERFVEYVEDIADLGEVAA